MTMTKQELIAKAIATMHRAEVAREKAATARERAIADLSKALAMPDEASPPEPR